MMKPNWRYCSFLYLGVFLAGLVGCGLGCAIAMKMAAPKKEVDMVDANEWLRAQLDMDPEQRRKLGEIGERFEEREQRFRKALAEANRDLGRVIQEEKTYTPRVAASVEMIHHAMADLQKATLEHLFEMENALTPEQYERLLQLARDALDK